MCSIYRFADRLQDGFNHLSLSRHPVFTDAMRRKRIPFYLLHYSFHFLALARSSPPVEIKDPAVRNLQQKYIDDLKIVGKDTVPGDFPYPE
jgi:hypothetical protein